jgi:hypothetical protein
VELKSVTVQLNRGGRKETHELTWDDKAKAYVSASGTVKVKDPKAKKVEVQVRKDVTKDRWEPFKGKCEPGVSGEEICKIENKKGSQQIKQITIRFAPTAKAAVEETGFLKKIFSDHVYTDVELKEKIAEWVDDKIADGRLKAPRESHIAALEKQLIGKKLIKNDLWAKLEAYTQSSQVLIGNQKPLFKYKKPPPTVEIQIVTPKPAKPEKPVSVSKEIAQAKAEMASLDQTIKALEKRGPKVLISDLKLHFTRLDRDGERVWATMQRLRKSNDSAALKTIEALKEARGRYQKAVTGVFTLLQKKVGDSVSGLNQSHAKMQSIAKKGPSAAAELKSAKRAFAGQYDLTKKTIKLASDVFLLPGEVSSPASKSLLEGLVRANAVNEQVAKVALSPAKPSAAPPPAPPTAPPAARAAAPAKPSILAITTAQKSLAQLERDMQFLPDPPVGGSSPYDKPKMDKVYNDGRMDRIYKLAVRLAEHVKDVDAIKTANRGASGVTELVKSLEKATLKLSGAQRYLITEKIDPNENPVHDYRAQDSASSKPADFEWLKDSEKHRKADALAKKVIRDLGRLMGASKSVLAKDLEWQADRLFHVAGNGTKLNSLKDMWEQAHAIKAAAYQYRMYGRLPVASGAAPTAPATAAGAPAVTPPAVADYLKKAEAALRLVDDVYYKLFAHNSRAPITNDKPVPAIYTDDVRNIPRELEAAKRAIEALPDISAIKPSVDDLKKLDDIHSKRTEAYTKLTKAGNRFNQVKDSAIERPALSAAEKKEIKAARSQYIAIRDGLKRAIADADRIYPHLFNTSGTPHSAAPAVAVQTKYIAQLESIKTRLNVELDEAVHGKLVGTDRVAWDDLQPQRGAAQIKVAEALNYLAELKKQRDAAAAAPKPAPKAPAPTVAGSDAPIDPKAAARPAAPGLGAQSAEDLLKQIQSNREMIAGSSNLSEAIGYRDAIYRILEEAQKRGLKVLEGSARRSLKFANQKVVDLGGLAKEAPTGVAAPARPAAAEPAAGAGGSASPAAKPKSAEPTAAEVAAQQRAAALEAAKAERETKAREAAELKEKQAVATQATTQLKARHDEIKNELRKLRSADSPTSFADRLKKLDEVEREIKASIESLKEHAAVIGPYAQGVQNNYEATLKSLPVLRADIEAAERLSSLQTDVSRLIEDSGKLMQQGEAILAKSVVDPADTSKLQALKGQLSEIETNLDKIFKGLPKENDSLRTRITTHLGKIREVSGRISDRIQHVTSLAKEDKPGSVERLRHEANTLITQSKKLRKEGKKSAAALQPILVRLNGIDKALEEIKGKLAEGDPLGQTILDHQIVIATEVEKIEDITKPKKVTAKAATPEAVSPAEPLPVEPTPAAAKAVEPPAPAKATEPVAPPPPTSKPGAAARVTEIQARSTVLSSKLDRFSSEAMQEGYRASETEFRAFLSDLKTTETDLATLKSLESDADAGSDARTQRGILSGVKDRLIDTAAFLLKLIVRSDAALKALPLEKRLAKLTEYAASLDTLKRKTEDATALRSTTDTQTIIQDKINELSAKKTGEPVSAIVSRLAAISELGGHARLTPDGKGIVIPDVSQDRLKDKSVMASMFRAIKPLDAEMPERVVVAASLQMQTSDILSIGMPLQSALKEKKIRDVVMLQDSRLNPGKATVTLYFDAAAAKSHRQLVNAEIKSSEDSARIAAAAAEAKRIAPLRAVQALAKANGGNAIEGKVMDQEVYGVRIKAKDGADALRFIREMVSKHGYRETSDFFIYAHPKIADELVNGASPMGVKGDRGSRILALTPSQPGDVFIATRSANYSFLMTPAFKSPDTLNKFMQKLGMAKNANMNPVEDKAVKEQQKRQAKAAAQGLNVKVGSDRDLPVASAPAVAPSGPITLPKVYQHAAITKDYLKPMFGLDAAQAGIYSGNVDPGSLQNNANLKTRIGNIMSHARQLGMDHVLILYRGVLNETKQQNFEKFSAIIRELDADQNFLRTRQVQGIRVSDSSFDKVHYVLIRDNSVKDDAVVQKHEAFIAEETRAAR